MFHLTLFGGTEGEISAAGFTAFTCFGSAELRSPTLASRIVHRKRRGAAPRTAWQRLAGGDDNLVITVFGGTVLMLPSIAEEYVALRTLLETGAVTRDELPALVEACMTPENARTALRTVTVLGACVTKRTTDKQERKAIAAAAETGTIANAMRRTLEALIESPPGTRERALSRLVCSTD